MYLTIPGEYRQAFLAYAARHAHRPLRMSLDGNTLRIKQMPARDIAEALITSAFVGWENHELTVLAAHKLACFEPRQREAALEIAHALIEEDVRRNTMASGPHRLERITTLAEQFILEYGRLDFLGFCRFALPGHISYMRRMLDIAADEILAEEENHEYLTLLTKLTAPSKNKLMLRLFFSEGAVCHIWQQDENGIRAVEGGCIRGAEDLLLANIIAARPKLVAISGAAYAPLSVTELLEEVFGARLSYEDHTEPLDFPPLQ